MEMNPEKMPGLLKQFGLLFKSRTIELFSYVWVVAIGAMIGSHGNPQVIPMVLAVSSALLISFCVYVYNDIEDAEMDKLNPKKRLRPLAAGNVSRANALKSVYITGLIGMIIPLFIGPQVFLLCLLWLALYLFYSKPPIRLKKKPVIKEMTPALGFFLSTVVGAGSAGSVTLTVFFAGIFCALFVFFGFPAFRDTSDIEEDRKFGVKSLATVLRWKQRLELIIIFILAIMTLTPLTYVNFGFNMIFPIAVVAMGLLALRFCFPLLTRLEEADYSKAYKVLFSFFFSSQIAMVVGTMF